ncbi:MAG: hypothetical protein H7Y00_04275 [Fimbriimonadaceae bacterium]|nr:hypothetical protein [Chitinophagales bacterium]
MGFTEQQKINNPLILGLFLFGGVAAIGGTTYVVYDTYAKGENVFIVI